MRRTILLLATMALTLLVASRVAQAVSRKGTIGADTLRGTNGNGADDLVGQGADDRIYSSPRGNDDLLGGSGKDVLLDILQVTFA
jgi:Ca2+-binding RTX toxin-like protein